MDKTIHCLDKTKVSQIGNTLIKFIGDNKTLFLSFQLQVLMVFSIKEFSCAVRKCISPDKKRRNNWKRKLWPITILSNLYKLFGQLMYGKTYDYFDKIHLKCLCEFGNENRAQQCLMAVIKKMEQHINIGATSTATLTHLPKSFDFYQNWSYYCQVPYLWNWRQFL